MQLFIEIQAFLQLTKYISFIFYAESLHLELTAGLVTIMSIFMLSRQICGD